MGKHHWKVEKQPEWYVKAVRKTIAALPGGYAEAAEWLDVTENALFNRLRADGDQIFPLGWAMILQRAAGTHYIADAVAQSAGGVFVSLPEIEEVENADINQRLLEVIEQIGSYSKQIRSAIEDGVCLCNVDQPVIPSEGDPYFRYGNQRTGKIIRTGC